MTSSKILFFLCISFVVGIFLESVIKIPQILLWAFLFIDFLAIIIFLLIKKDFLIIAGFCLLILVMGILRVQISEFNVASDKLSKFNDKGQVVLTGIISNEPDVRDTYQKIRVKIGVSAVLVAINRYPEYRYLDKIKLTGKLETPAETEDFSYKNYLMKDGIYSVMGFPNIELVSQKYQYNIFSYFYEKILFLKQKLRESIFENFSPPESFILQGIVLGDKTTIPQDIKNKLNITGISHIIAVSGTHIVVLSSIIMSFLLFLGFCRGHAFYFSAVFICFYIILVGLPASGVRAAIMGIIYLLGQKLGRQNTSSRIIVLAAALMLLQNPLLLFYDVGFQLSFLAVLGLIYLEPYLRALIKFFIKQSFKKDLKEKYDSAAALFSATISAQIFTLPIIIYNFGNISFVSPIANLLILPMIYYLMLFGFLSAFAGIFSGILGWILSVPCYFLMRYFLWIIDIFSKPWAFRTIENIHWLWLLTLYLIIFSATYFLRKKYSRIF